MEFLDFLDKLNEEYQYLSEAEYTKQVEKLKLEILDVDKYVKENRFKQITNPVTFIRDGSPTPDGLLSNEIFGITKADRAGIFAYIDLHGTFLDPSIYKAWCKIDSRIKSIVHETEKYIINDNGELEANEKGKTGIKFLKDNIDKINFRRTTSNKRDLKIEYIKANTKVMFLTKYMVIPAYYRDMNTAGKNVGIGAINKLYVSLLQTVHSLESTLDYGFSDNGAIAGRIQELLVAIYDWFVGNSNAMIAEEGTGISRKMGILRRANMSKTTDNSSRLVLSAPDNRVESVDDLMVTYDKTAIPLAAAMADFYDFVLFHVKKFFENEFGTVSSYMVVDSTGKVNYYTPKDPLIEFSDERIKKEMKRFIHGYSNRLIPIEVPLEDGPKGKTFYMTFKGKNKNDNIEGESIYSRKLTWLDIFYQATIKATEDKCIYFSRFPIDSYMNQYPSKIVVTTTVKTEPMYIDGEYYKYYPYIRDEMIGKDTSKMFIDTCQPSDLYLAGAGADFDGDTGTTKSIYFTESIEEAEKFIYSKFNFISLGCENIRTVGKDAVQSIYSMTKVLPETKLTNPVF